MSGSADPSGTAPPAARYVGQSVARLEDPRLLTGRGRYVANLAPVGTGHAAFARSTRARARITRLDVKAAAALDGVWAVWTGADLNPEVGSLRGSLVLPGGGGPPDHLLADGDVRFVGDPVGGGRGRQPRRGRRRPRTRRDRLRGAGARAGLRDRRRDRRPGTPGVGVERLELGRGMAGHCRRRHGRRRRLGARRDHPEPPGQRPHGDPRPAGRVAGLRRDARCVDLHAEPPRDRAGRRSNPRPRRAPGARAHGRRRWRVRPEGLRGPRGVRRHGVRSASRPAPCAGSRGAARTSHRPITRVATAPTSASARPPAGASWRPPSITWRTTGRYSNGGSPGNGRMACVHLPGPYRIGSIGWRTATVYTNTCGRGRLPRSLADRERGPGN